VAVARKGPHIDRIQSSQPRGERIASRAESGDERERDEEPPVSDRDLSGSIGLT